MTASPSHPFSEQEFVQAFSQFMEREDAELMAREMMTPDNSAQGVFGVSLTEETLVALASVSECADRVEKFRRVGVAMMPKTQ